MPGMPYAKFGRTGLKVSRLCLGTMNFGPETSEKDAFRIMDRALEPGETAAIEAAIAGQLADGMTYHELRTRRIGPRRLADVHLLVPGSYSVRAGHALATSVERAVCTVLPDTEITVHVEPLEGDRGPGHDPGNPAAPAEMSTPPPDV